MSGFAVTVRAALKPYQIVLPAPVRAVVEAAADHIEALQRRVDDLEMRCNELEKKHVSSLESSAAQS
jgi:hypothetical protein